MNKKELMKEAFNLYNELQNNRQSHTNANNVIICRRLHLIEKELNEPLNYNICKNYMLQNK